VEAIAPFCTALTSMSGLRPRLVTAGAVAAALVVGGLIVLRPSAPSPTALGCDAGSDPVKTAPVAVIATGSPVTFQETWADDVTLPDTGSGFFNAVASLADRAVAVGRLEGATSRALIVLSDDGRTWRVASDGGPRFSRAEAVDAVATADGFAVAGSMSTNDRGVSAGAIWWSQTGERWQRQPPQPVAYIHQLASGPRGLLATASTAEGDPVLGSSTDGRDWRWTAWPTRGSPNDVAPIQGGWISVGSIGVGGDDRVPVVWRSTDGAQWTCQVLSTTPNEPFGNAVSVYPGRATTLIRGHINADCSPLASCAASDAVWVATTDGSWRRLESEDAPILRAVAVAPDGSFVALTETGLSRSDDGTTWRELSDQVPPEGAPNSIGVAPWGLVAVGGTYQGAVVRPFITFLPAE
jgi:hypothetical protein